MCGRYSLRATGEELTERFGADGVGFEPTYNAAPGQSLPVVREEERRSLDLLDWGLVPSWSDDADGYINARSETVAEKPSFAEAYEGRRCLVPVDGFYEWDDDPYYVGFERVAGLAGIWERRVPDRRQSGLDEFGGEGDGQEVQETFAILTTEPNEQVARLHHRMAAVLAPEEEDGWLDGSLTADELDPRDEPATVRRVSERVNDPSNDDPSLVEGM
ncbi:SOS response-associated peptidase [Haladaptatus sp. F3-133]|uniref:SOS response-associated peptidase n=1 Tax=Halorutilus salinus TaxID=2487751 RepID=A0A9Q4C645_9EURY|nr:SOS response-associated peptidase [Halorutilus salinus]MCX2819644.1 SOS response-associated peptidase [Halorutilus salinus]